MIVDLHTHVIPEIDDGAEDWETSLEMLRMAKQNGTDAMVLTPHYPNRVIGTDADADTYKKIIEAFMVHPQVKETGMQLFVGAETYCGASVIGRIADNQLIPIHQSRYVLCEFPVNENYDFFLTVREALAQHGLVPVLAHTERYACLWGHRERQRELAQHGFLFQVNAETVMGRNSRESLATADSLFRDELVAVVASDTHNLFSRRPDLSEAHARLSLRFSADAADILLCDNPAKIIQNLTVL